MKRTIRFTFLFLLLGAFSTAHASCNNTISVTRDTSGAYIFTAVGASAGDSIQWDFGDDSIGRGTPAIHRYISTGYYHLFLTTLDTSGCHATFDTIEYLSNNQSYSCQASISSAITNQPVLNGYDFRAIGNFSIHAIATWHWNDGSNPPSFQASRTARHYFVRSGHFPVCVQIVDSSMHCQFTICDTIIIPSYGGCAASINYTHLDTTFSISASSAGVGPFTYLWSLPGGITSAVPNPIITLPLSSPRAPYHFSLIITDSTGCIDTTSATIYGDSVLSSSTACIAYFVMMQDTGTVGHYYAIDHSIGAGGITNYLWSFGDGTTAMGQYPTHTYATPGFYTVCLTISDSLHGCRSSFYDSSFYAYKTAGSPMSSFSVHRKSASGVPDVKQNELFTVYPNPATSVIELRLSNSDKIEKSMIYNTAGQEVAEYGALSQIPVSNLSKGMYFIEVKASSSTFRSLFVK